MEWCNFISHVVRLDGPLTENIPGVYQGCHKGDGEHCPTIFLTANEDGDRIHSFGHILHCNLGQKGKWPWTGDIELIYWTAIELS